MSRVLISCMRMMTTHGKHELLISIVENKTCVRESLSSFFRSLGYKTKEYPTAEDYLVKGSSDVAACIPERNSSQLERIRAL